MVSEIRILEFQDFGTVCHQFLPKSTINTGLKSLSTGVWQGHPGGRGTFRIPLRVPHRRHLILCYGRKTFMVRGSCPWSCEISLLTTSPAPFLLRSIRTSKNTDVFYSTSLSLPTQVSFGLLVLFKGPCFILLIR